MNSSTWRASGAPPLIMRRTRPPIFSFTLQNTTRSASGHAYVRTDLLLTRNAL